MILDPETAPHADVHRLLIGVVIPRPIAFVSTTNAEGRHNLAPFSFFNLIATQPPLLILGLNSREGQPKDSLRNIRETRDFVVNLVDEPLHARMVETSGDWPADVSEFELTGLTPLPSERVRSPRLAESPVQLECALEQIVEFGDNDLVVGKILLAHASDAIFTEGRVDPLKLRPVARLGGTGYTVIREVLHMSRPRVPRATS